MRCGQTVAAAVTWARRWSRRAPLWAAVLTLVAGSRLAAIGPAEAQTPESGAAWSAGMDDAVAAELSGQPAKYPWFNAERGGARPVELRATPQPVGPAQMSAPRGWEWWTDWFEWDSSSTGRTWSTGDFWLQVTRIVGVLGLVVIVLLILMKLRRSMLDQARAASAMQPTTSDAARIEQLPIELAERDVDLLQRARQLRDAGRLDQAIIYLFSHLLVTLDRTQRLRLDKGKTNRQYLRELRGGADLRDILRETTRAFEDVFFGGHALSAVRSERIWSSLDQFHQLAHRPLSIEANGGAA